MIANAAPTNNLLFLLYLFFIDEILSQNATQNATQNKKGEKLNLIGILSGRK
jgi:hypothetical protein